MNLSAEIIAVGDELTSGQRLDTNSQWISQSLGELGILVRFQTTVGDELADHISVLKIAIARADIVVMTGGLGPTADDLTRAAIAQSANVELEFHSAVLKHIKTMYSRRDREMPESNRAQAYFPAGSKIVDNPEGTAPGIDLTVTRDDGTTSRIFALPGVPVEMRQMWSGTVEPELKAFANTGLTTHHHTLHCFGLGESSIETMLPNLIQRGRDPQVGITASAATISLRVSTRAQSKEQCLEKMRPTITLIEETLGDLIFGENGQTLETVVMDLLSQKKQSLAVAAGTFDGELASTLKIEFVDNDTADRAGDSIASNLNQLHSLEFIKTIAHTIRNEQAKSLGIAVSRLDEDEPRISRGESKFHVALASADGIVTEQFNYGGHSGWRRQRAIKQVLNFLRLWLIKTGD